MTVIIKEVVVSLSLNVTEISVKRYEGFGSLNSIIAVNFESSL